jgi:hypothetical protein
VHAKKAQVLMELQIHSFLSLAYNGDDWSISRAFRFNPKKETLLWASEFMLSVLLAFQQKIMSVLLAFQQKIMRTNVTCISTEDNVDQCYLHFNRR